MVSHFKRVALGILAAWLLLAAALSLLAAPLIVTVSDPQGAAGRLGAPVSAEVDLHGRPNTNQFRLKEPGQTTSIDAQFVASEPGSGNGTLFWQVPPGAAGERKFEVTEAAARLVTMRVFKDERSKRFEIREGKPPVLVYNHGTVEPGEILAKIAPDNLQYARPRSDYIHPLYGPDGEELTKDWSVDHPHHRGIYWAWPEVDYKGQRGDLHALQRVFARPTGVCDTIGGPVFAQISAENEWRWEDKEPIVRERAIIRAWHVGAAGRCIDLEFRFTAMADDVAIARRDTKLYGGLNIRLAAVKDQQIAFHVDAADKQPRMAWAGLSGTFPSGKQPVGLAVFQHPGNPDYPADGIKYPEINWFQPTFPAAGTRYVLKKDRPLVLRYRFWIHSGKSDDAKMADIWAAYTMPPKITIDK
ncbi:MAG: DUF6807 family protein [Tepidisphaerales bacterium]